VKKCVFVTFASSALLAAQVSLVHAADATWVGGTPAPAGSDYGAAANWTPAGPPNGTATFGASANTNVFVASAFNLDGWSFNPGASAYTFTLNNSSGRVDFFGAGITINGGSASIINNNVMVFHNSSTAGSATIANSNFLLFDGTSTAGSAAITNNFILSFYDSSTAGSAAITNNSFGDGLNFRFTSTAGNATITNNGGTNFRDSSTAGNAAITHHGNGSVNFRETPSTTTAA
jgi:fibronectin-binding autotransporter adhesin